jgi:hypothetical protein
MPKQRKEEKKQFFTKTDQRTGLGLRPTQGCQIDLTFVLYNKTKHHYFWCNFLGSQSEEKKRQKVNS